MFCFSLCALGWTLHTLRAVFFFVSFVFFCFFFCFFPFRFDGTTGWNRRPPKKYKKNSKKSKMTPSPTHPPLRALKKNFIEKKNEIEKKTLRLLSLVVGRSQVEAKPKKKKPSNKKNSVKRPPGSNKRNSNEKSR